jgi:hypothetical protein
MGVVVNSRKTPQGQTEFDRLSSRFVSPPSTDKFGFRGSGP